MILLNEKLCKDYPEHKLSRLDFSLTGNVTNFSITIKKNLTNDIYSDNIHMAYARVYFEGSANGLSVSSIECQKFDKYFTACPVAPLPSNITQSNNFYLDIPLNVFDQNIKLNFTATSSNIKTILVAINDSNTGFESKAYDKYLKAQERP